VGLKSPPTLDSLAARSYRFILVCRSRPQAVWTSMSFISLEQLPFVGMSHEFVGETQGAPFSAYIVKAKPLGETVSDRATTGQTEGAPFACHAIALATAGHSGGHTASIRSRRAVAGRRRELRRHDASSDRHPRQSKIRPDELATHALPGTSLRTAPPARECLRSSLGVGGSPPRHR
jgi:hypothetical protein